MAFLATRTSSVKVRCRRVTKQKRWVPLVVHRQGCLYSSLHPGRHCLSPCLHSSIFRNTVSPEASLSLLFSLLRLLSIAPTNVSLSFPTTPSRTCLTRKSQQAPLTSERIQYRAIRGEKTSRKLQYGIAVGSGEASAGGLSKLVTANTGTSFGGAASNGNSYANGFGFADSPGIGDAFGGGIGSASGNTTASGGETDPISALAFSFGNAGGGGLGIFGPGPAALFNSKSGGGKNEDEDLIIDSGPFGGATGGGGGGFAYGYALGNGTGSGTDVYGQAYGNSQGVGVGYGGGSNSAGNAGGTAGGNAFGLGGGVFDTANGLGFFNSAGGGYGSGTAGGYLGEDLPTTPGLGGFSP